jgi:hypothetical protein
MATRKYWIIGRLPGGRLLIHSENDGMWIPLEARDWSEPGELVKSQSPELYHSSVKKLVEPNALTSSMKPTSCVPSFFVKKPVSVRLIREHKNWNSDQRILNLSSRQHQEV